MKVSIFFISFLFVLFWTLPSEASQKTVEISLSSKWPTSLIAEISEYFATKGNVHFWNFIENLIQHDLEKMTEEESYNTLMGLAEQVLNPSDLSFLKLASSLRYYSPTVYMFQKIGMERKGGCGESFADVGGKVACDQDQMINLLETEHSKLDQLHLDHSHPESGSSQKWVILYSDLSSNYFKQWHQKLKSIAKETGIVYIFRHYQPNPSQKIYLSGYGVELAIKNTEYKAVDDSKIEEGEKGQRLRNLDSIDLQGFNFTVLKKLHSEKLEELTEFQTHLSDTTHSMKPLKVWQLQDLSFQAAQQVMREPPEKQLHTFISISQNFPSKARQLINVQVESALRSAVKRNQEKLQDENIFPGEARLFVNGLSVDLDPLNLFTLYDLLREESKLVSGLQSLHSNYQLDKKDIQDIMYLATSETNQQNYGLDIREQNVIYLNDLENDRLYRNWPASVTDLLRPTFPGMLKYIKKNLFNLILFFNPLDIKSIEILKIIEGFYQHTLPLRIGFVFVVNPEVDKYPEALKLTSQAFCHILKKRGPSSAISFLIKAQRIDKERLDSGEEVASVFSSIISSSEIQEILASPCFDLEKTLEKYHSSGLTSLPKVLMNGVPLKDEEVENELEENLIKLIFKQTNDMQKAVYKETLTDEMDSLEFLMDQSHIVKRLNTQIFNINNKFIELFNPTEAKSLENFKPEDLKTISNEYFSDSITRSMKYLSKNEQDYQMLTFWVVGDLSTREGRAIFQAALKHLKQSQRPRVGLIHNPINVNNSYLATVVQTAIETLPLNVAKNFINKILKNENAEEILKDPSSLPSFSVGNMNMEEFISNLEKHQGILEAHSIYSRSVLGFKQGGIGVVANGKIFGPLLKDSPFLEEDFDVLEKFIYSRFAQKMEKKFKKIKLPNDKKSDLSLKLESLLLSSRPEKRLKISFEKEEACVINLNKGTQAFDLHFIAMLDPASKEAQKILPILGVLDELFSPKIQIFFNSREKLSELPLKSYYRFVLDAELMFKDSKLESPQAIFTQLPERSLLTLSTDTPESWLVECIRSPYDLDNIFLHEVETKVSAEFELDKLILEGHCYDAASGVPPRGLQFELRNSGSTDLVDTIVMANLGYFQLKASPGLWYLKLREGKSKDLYDIVSINPKMTQEDIYLVAMESFKGKVIHVKVVKKRGKESEDLLGDEEDSFGLWHTFSKTLGGSDTKQEEDDVINVFSLASGHLYERFLRVMMLSVTKHTKSKVKFWFLKNYLSPNFKNFIPKMAAKYNFQYELVQYKWPRWLHRQTEKQRIIWGYKILFLDVLFPLNVTKIIFVDADQTVRADLKELVDLDLGGAPYGYTPFCESRKEMDGYRFWKSGYWANHLGDRKYHISALYVVDLKKFRKVAAGDRLRGQYNGLSQDPNSLSNLDQDLPNNMIHQVGIKSLPQEWLWCETWCSDESKPSAKTIDLCNNPKTKEPKLDAALRIVAEWKSYDQEIRSLWDSWQNKKSEDVDKEKEDQEDQKKHIEL